MTTRRYFLSIQFAIDYLESHGFERVYGGTVSYANFNSLIGADICQDRGGIVVRYSSI